METNDTHDIVQVRIDGADVNVACGCGWVSGIHASETDARVEHEEHRQANGRD